MNWIVKLGALCTALVAIGGVLAWLASFLAFASDIKRLDRQQVDSAIETYSRAEDDHTIRQQQLTDPTLKALNMRRLDDVSKRLDELR